MAVTYGSTAVATSSISTSPSFSVPTAAGDTRLLVLVAGTNAANIPTGVTYNGASLVPDGSAAAGFNVSVWHIDSFTPGSFNVVVTRSSLGTIAAVAIPLVGANLSLAPALGASNTTTGTAASCSVTGAGANDLQLAFVAGSSNSLTEAGSPQFAVPGPTIPINNVAGTSGHSFSFDYVTPGSAGNFAWTLATSGIWLAQGLLIAGAGGPLLSSIGVVSTIN